MERQQGDGTRFNSNQHIGINASLKVAIRQALYDFWWPIRGRPPGPSMGCDGFAHAERLSPTPHR